MGACQNKDIYDPYDARPTASASASANGNAREQPKLATEAPLPVEQNLMRSPSERDVTNMTAEDMGRRKFEDHYTEGKQIGYGAFAVVFIGTNKEFNKTYAIKKIDRSKMMWGGRDALKDEINNLRALREGPNIVKLYDEFYNKDDCYLVMELMVGGELFDRIIEKRTFSELEARAVAKCMLEALDYMHTNRVVHRDLKPENLLLNTTDANAIIKLTDFGFAKEVNLGLVTPCYTPYYVAPEVLGSVKYDISCDIWSLGVIMYILCCGYPPFYSTHGQPISPGMKRRIKAGEYAFPENEWSRVSREAKTLIHGMLETVPDKRITIDDIMKSKWISQYYTVPQTPLPSLEVFKEDRAEWSKALDEMRINWDTNIKIKELPVANNPLLERRMKKSKTDAKVMQPPNSIMLPISESNKPNNLNNQIIVEDYSRETTLVSMKSASSPSTSRPSTPNHNIQL